MAANKGRPGSARAGKKGAKRSGAPSGSGGKGRRALEGRGPTPKAEDREYHAAYRRKKAAERRQVGLHGAPGGQGRQQRQGRGTTRKSADMVAGRNSVLDALTAGIPAQTLYVSTAATEDDRVKQALKLAAARGVPLLEASKFDLDRLTEDAVHQGIALQIPPYEYAAPEDFLALAAERGERPLIVALDGVTDPRNLGAVIRSAAAFGAHGVVVPERRSVSMTATAWKTAAGAAARVKVARVPNLTRCLEAYKAEGVFAIGLDGHGEVALPGLELADQPLVVVVGAEGAGVSRLVRETCDQIVSIPIAASTESLNASVAAAVALYEIVDRRR